ncbi:hypothetical protein [Blastococcus saxobsidens]|uniref:Uncharacterized protein n=1 Tax=Blastococcus saxobsidens (strain DD2) TaxID=1146883 RepID=H6RP48_BLASD|nr:hypothetical protein [Blastococcus saxobsidens]CCG02709.1 conserved protein of unknown function [Blastococcus saxobsidens DD2]
MTITQDVEDAPDVKDVAEDHLEDIATAAHTAIGRLYEEAMAHIAYLSQSWQQPSGQTPELQPPSARPHVAASSPTSQAA